MTSQALDEKEVEKVIELLRTIAEHSSKLAGVLEQERARSFARNPRGGREHYKQLDYLLQKFKKEVKKTTGWFSVYDQLEKHVEQRIKDMQKLERQRRREQYQFQR